MIVCTCYDIIMAQILTESINFYFTTRNIRV